MLQRKEEDFAYALLPSVYVKSLNGKDMTEAEMNGRKQALAYIQAFQKFMPGMEQCKLVSTGPGIALRESYRIYGRYELCENDIIYGKEFQDSIAVGGWTPEIHQDMNKMCEYIKMEVPCFEIPLRSLKTMKIENLYCGGKIISTDFIAFSSVRVMGTCFATGQAAGVAAAVKAMTGKENIQKIQEILFNQGAIIKVPK